MQYSWRPEEGIQSPETGVTDGCELPCGCREQNSGLLKQQQVLLTMEPSLQHLRGTQFERRLPKNI